MRLKKIFTGRWPDTQSILGVYGVIVCLVYSWTLFTSFYKIPSWLFYLDLGQIASIYAYSFFADLVESLLLLFFVLLLDVTVFLLFRNKAEFQSRAVTIVVVLLGTAMLRLLLFKDYEDIGAFVGTEPIWWGIAVPLAFVISVIAAKFVPLRKILDGFANRAVVFLYIYLPLSLASLAVVLFRNI